MQRQGRILHKMMLGMFVLLLAGGIGLAQSAVNVKIPFNFNIGAQRFSAGEYSLSPLQQDRRTMLLRDQKGQALTNFLTCSVESREVPSSGKLVFRQYGGRYFLAQIWKEGNVTGQEMIKSHAEIEMAKAESSSGQLVALNFAPQR